MKVKTVLFFLAATCVALFAASYRFYDSAHTIGVIKATGGEARHPIVLDPGLKRYTLIATATVLPPYRGDIRVALEGLPEMEYAIYNNEPAIDLSPFRHPVFRNNTLYGVQPKDQIALWVVMKWRGDTRPGDLTLAAAEEAAAAGSCCAVGAPPLEKVPVKGDHPHSGTPAKQTLAFYDTKSGQQLLTVPITFREEGGATYGQAH